MRRILEVLALSATALFFAAADPGTAAAGQGRSGGIYDNAPLDTHLNKAHNGHRTHGQNRRRGERHVSGKHRRHHARGHRHYGHRYRHRGRWHRRYGHRHYHGLWPRIRLHVYRPYNPPPPAYLPPPPAYPVQPAAAEQKVADAGHPSSCLMTREYQTEILVGGELVPAYGRACLQPDGSWYRGPAVPEHY